MKIAPIHKRMQATAGLVPVLVHTGQHYGGAMSRVFFEELGLPARYPNPEQKILNVRLHPLANESADAAIRHLCAEINATETLFPGIDLRLIYQLVSSRNP